MLCPCWFVDCLTGIIFFGLLTFCSGISCCGFWCYRSLFVFSMRKQTFNFKMFIVASSTYCSNIFHFNELDIIRNAPVIKVLQYFICVLPFMLTVGIKYFLASV